MNRTLRKCSFSILKWYHILLLAMIVINGQITVDHNSFLGTPGSAKTVFRHTLKDTLIRESRMTGLSTTYYDTVANDTVESIPDTNNISNDYFLLDSLFIDSSLTIETGGNVVWDFSYLPFNAIRSKSTMRIVEFDAIQDSSFASVAPNVIYSDSTNYTISKKYYKAISSALSLFSLGQDGLVVDKTIMQLPLVYNNSSEILDTLNNGTVDLIIKTDCDVNSFGIVNMPYGSYDVLGLRKRVLIWSENEQAYQCRKIVFSFVSEANGIVLEIMVTTENNGGVIMEEMFNQGVSQILSSFYKVELVYYH